MATVLDQLILDVADESTVIDSAITLLEGLAAQLRAAGTDPVKLAALDAAITASKTKLAAAIVANTPGGPPTGGTPSISSISPTAGPNGTTVTVNGSGFGATQGTSTLNVENSPVATTSWSDTAIVFVVANPGPATIGIKVTVGANSSAVMNFSVSA